MYSGVEYVTTHYILKQQHTLSNTLHIESLICHTNENTGFLIWLGDYCMSCIFQKTSIKNMSYSLLAYDDDDSSPTSTVHFVKNIQDKHT